MSTQLALAFIGLGCAVGLVTRGAARIPAIIALVALGVRLLMLLGVLSLRMEMATVLPWIIAAGAGIAIFLRQDGKIGVALATVLTFASALPALSYFGVLR